MHRPRDRLGSPESEGNISELSASSRTLGSILRKRALQSAQPCSEAAECGPESEGWAGVSVHRGRVQSDQLCGQARAVGFRSHRVEGSLHRSIVTTSVSFQFWVAFEGDGLMFFDISIDCLMISYYDILT